MDPMAYDLVPRSQREALLERFGDGAVLALYLMVWVGLPWVGASVAALLGAL
jgi:hypothetical protein